MDLFRASEKKLIKLAKRHRVRQIARYLSYPDRKLRLAAIRALGICDGEEAFDLLAQQLRSGEPDIRAEAANALGIGRGSRNRGAGDA